MNNLDIFYMKRALQLAEKGRGFASPNPVVGACLVRNGKLIAESFHARFGESHAEVRALEKAGIRAKGATLYVTLEPCSTWGKTPPCVRTIVESGIKRIVIAALDVNPKHAGKGIRTLRRAGISVQTGILRKEAEVQNDGFRKWIQTKLPFVTLKLAQSLDGKISTLPGSSPWISGKEARIFAHQLRAKSDCIVVGRKTAELDNPRLTVRHVRSDWQPWRFVLDSKGRISPKLCMFREKGISGLVCSGKNFKAVSQKFRSVPLTLFSVRDRKGRLDLQDFLRRLGSFGLTSVLIEGGGELAASFLKASLVDKLYLIVSPKVMGGKGASWISPPLDFSTVKTFKCGKDLIIEQL